MISGPCYADCELRCIGTDSRFHCRIGEPEVDHGTASNQVAKCKVTDHRPLSDPVFLTDQSSADTSAVRKTPFTDHDQLGEGDR